MEILSRRDFLKEAALAGLGLVGLLIPGSIPGSNASGAAAALGKSKEQGQGNINRLEDVDGPLPLGIINVDELAPDGWLKEIFTPGTDYHDYTQPLEGSSPWLISGVVIDASENGANRLVDDRLDNTPHMRVRFPLGGVEVVATIPLWDTTNTTSAQAFSVWDDSITAFRSSFKANTRGEVMLLPNYVGINDQVLAMVHGGEEPLGPAWLGGLDGANGQIVTPQLALLVVPSCR